MHRALDLCVRARRVIAQRLRAHGHREMRLLSVHELRDMGDHRAARAHYKSALRYATGLEPPERASLTASYAHECFLADDLDGAIASQNDAVTFRRNGSDVGALGRAISDLAEFRRRWPDAVPKLITGRFKIEQAIDLLTGKVGGIKNVVSLR